MTEEVKGIKLKPRRRRRTIASPTAGWGMVAEAAQRLGLLTELSAHAARRSFAVACHRLVPRLEPHARAEGLDPEGRTLIVRVSSSAVASELVYVKDLLLAQINQELAAMAPVLRGGRRGPSPAHGPPMRITQLQYRVAPVRALPDYAAWTAEELRPPLPDVPQRPWDLEVAAELGRVTDAGTRDALAALYAAATGASPNATKAAPRRRR